MALAIVSPIRNVQATAACAFGGHLQAAMQSTRTHEAPEHTRGDRTWVDLPPLCVFLPRVDWIPSPRLPRRGRLSNDIREVQKARVLMCGTITVRYRTVIRVPFVRVPFVRVPLTIHVPGAL